MNIVSKACWISNCQVELLEGVATGMIFHAPAPLLEPHPMAMTVQVCEINSHCQRFLHEPWLSAAQSLLSSQWMFRFLCNVELWRSIQTICHMMSRVKPSYIILPRHSQDMYIDVNRIHILCRENNLVTYFRSIRLWQATNILFQFFQRSEFAWSLRITNNLINRSNQF